MKPYHPVLGPPRLVYTNGIDFVDSFRIAFRSRPVSYFISDWVHLTYGRINRYVALVALMDLQHNAQFVTLLRNLSVEKGMG